MRILGVDPGSKNIGIAISDPSGTIANPLTIIKHGSRPVDAAVIAALALENDASLIIVGQAIDDKGEPTFEGRKSARLAAAIRNQTSLPVVLWDESSSTQAARQARLQMGVARAKRSGHLDDLAAAIILQSYLDARPREESSPDHPPKLSL
jgi:putative holliday junction resolvase